MKQSSKAELEILDLINRIQSQLLVLDQKVETLIRRSSSDAKPTPKAPSPLPLKPNERNNARQMFKAICADCNKECSIPFKPSLDRPVYCQDCFSRRRVISLSGMSNVDKPKEAVSLQTPNQNESQHSKTQTKTKTSTKKKSITPKKKSTPKKK